MKNGLSGTRSRRSSAGSNLRSCGQHTFHLEARLIQNPIRKVLSLIGRQRVRALLMGGQACILYGGVKIQLNRSFREY